MTMTISTGMNWLFSKFVYWCSFISSTKALSTSSRLLLTVGQLRYSYCSIYHYQWSTETHSLHKLLFQPTISHSVEVFYSYLIVLYRNRQRMIMPNGQNKHVAQCTTR